MEAPKGNPIVPAPNIYASYLLRLWRVRTNAQTVWIAAVLSPLTGEERHFPSVEALVEFLLREFNVGEAADTDPAPGPPAEGCSDE